MHFFEIHHFHCLCTKIVKITCARRGLDNEHGGRANLEQIYFANFVSGVLRILRWLRRMSASMSLAAHRVYDSLPVRRSILGNASSSCDSGLHPFPDVLAPSSSWATPCSFSLHFQYLFLEPFMSLHMAKIL